ncbi:MAG: hypothetical protein EKK40_07030 [Bradyrhizobiaceae bacterium]|nr:MAG: hypothetical protein EKK40_07030 [Bradyrhizobiaceae bacterium]
MPVLNIEGRRVNVDDSFMKLSPEQQSSTVEEIASSFKNPSQSAEQPQPTASQQEPADHGLSERQKLSPVEKAISPITSYPETYQRMNQESRDLMSQGASQIADAYHRAQPGSMDGLWDATKGAAKVGAGALGFLASPINAAYRSVVGQPIEDVTGIPREQTEFVAQLATPGIGLPGAVSKSASIPGVATRVVEEKTVPTIAELDAAAAKGFNSPKVEKLAIKPKVISDFSLDTKLALNEAGIDENLAPKTFGILGNLDKVPESSIVTGKNINSLRRMFGNAAKSPDPTERLAASRAIESLDGLLPSISKEDVISGYRKAVPKILEEARANYSAARHAETIDNQTIQAELRAAASNSGQNVANTVRQRMADILKPGNQKQQRGFTPEELAQMETIVRGTPAQNAIRYAGNALGGGGGLGTAVSAGIGAAAAGPMGAALPAMGWAMKSLSNKLTLKQAEKLSEMVRSRAPLASSVRKFEESASSLASARNARNISSAVIAARNLSNNLRSGGFNIAPGDLLRALQSPQGANADEQ